MNTRGDPADLCLAQMYRISTHSDPQNQFSIKDKQRIPTVKSLRGTICFYVNCGGYVTNVN